MRRTLSKKLNLTMESLETREVPASVSISSGVLRVEGSANNDLIEIVSSNRIVNATVKDATTGNLIASGRYDTSIVRINSLRVDAFGGDDIIKNRTSLASDIRGGNGNDHLYGGTGSDMLCGGLGNDVLVSIGGGQTDILWGQGDSDSFWLDAEATERIGDLDTQERANGHVHRVAGFRANIYELDLDADDGRVQDQPTVIQGVGRELNGVNLMDPPQRKADGSLVRNNFSDRVLFSASGPTSSDIDQGLVGDCYFLSTLGAIADRNQDLIRQLVVDLGDGTYAVHFRNADGTDAFIRVDGDLWTSDTDLDKPSYAGLGVDDSLWVAIVEKAWAFHRHNQSVASTSRGTYDSASNASGYFDMDGEVPLYSALGLSTFYVSNGSAANAPAGNRAGVPTDSLFPTQRAFITYLQNEIGPNKAVTLSAHSSLRHNTPLVRTFAAPAAEQNLRKIAVETRDAFLAQKNANPLDPTADTLYNIAQNWLDQIDSYWQANSWSTSPSYRTGQHVYMVVSVSADQQTVTLRNPYNGSRLVNVSASDLFFTCRGIRSYQVS